ncbi:MAG: FMN-binding negative transcriptional regulator [Acidobacteriota bacterium]|nr:FMN-binding negative transcriptional regulator [Acidobacteriota bacterium]
MYIRASHRPKEDAHVVEIVRRHMFATMITASADGMIASHLPFVFEPEKGEHGTLFAHMARANAQGAVIGSEAEALVIFSGPHAYISPSWYADRATAPTWDYIAVHCYGPTRRHSEVEARENIARLIDAVEAPMTKKWSMNELAEQEVRAMLGNIVSFEIPVGRIEAKFKLNQGEKPNRTRAAIEELERNGAEELARYMRAYNGL